MPSFPRAVLLLTVLLGACASSARRSSNGPLGTAPSSAAVPLDAAGRHAAFDQVWSHIARRYYDAGFNGTDWQAVRARYGAAIDSLSSDASLHPLLASMVAELHDEASRYLSPAEARAQRTRAPTSFGAMLGEIDGVPVVESVTRGLAAERAGLRPGMRVVAVNDVPVADRFAAVYGSDRSASSERARRALTWRRVLAGDDSVVRLTVETSNGEPLTVRLRRHLVLAQPRVSARMLEGGVLYTRWDGFRAAIASALADSLRAHADAQALVIDLRANGGGDAAETLRAIGLFLPTRVVTGEFFTRVPRRRLGLFPSVAPQPLHAGGSALWTKPVVILTSTLSGSGAEMMAAVLQERRRAVVVGDTTCGCLTAISNKRRVLGGGLLEMSDHGYRTAGGTVIEGRGVHPNLARTPTRDDLAQGRDPVLAAALAHLAGR